MKAHEKALKEERIKAIRKTRRAPGTYVYINEFVADGGTIVYRTSGVKKSNSIACYKNGSEIAL